ncbi:M1 family metallopeptidase [Hufsiella ginkgonis]|uniref:Aminopeptidase N n=1 Tax=Hufsiella ginkgonis TaxID=2695274 RepID=A0A7K1XTN1_9SPHI|nr:M1 family metallopeptidase [Hufsiella ginkgonis]MXV14373.1 M1 family peptidase [Hufsiella ginkgonis]
MKLSNILACLLFPVAQHGLAQVNPAIDIRHYTFNVTINDDNDRIQGRASIDLKLNQPADSVVLDLMNVEPSGKGMKVEQVLAAGTPAGYRQTAEKLVIYITGAKSSIVHVDITYAGIPANGLVISKNQFGQRTFFADNWPNRARYWVPCIDHPADKATVTFVVTAPAHYRVVANGLLVSENAAGGQKTTTYAEPVPLPTKVMVFGAADFNVKQTGKVGDVAVSSWTFDKEPRPDGYDSAPAILKYLVETVGPFSYGKLAHVQSKTMFGGMENAGAIFYFEKSPGDAGIESLIAHETAHQWFGDAATEKNWPHVWLSEGFATYLTNTYLEQKYGADSLKKRMAEQRTKIINFERRRFTPVIDSVQDNYMQILNANSYEKGAWTLHMLRRKLGDKQFWEGIRTYYKLYRDRNADTDDLRRVFEKISGTDLKPFFTQWLYRPGSPKLAVKWEYDSQKKDITLRVTQTQADLYDVPLEFSLPGDMKPRTMQLRNRTTVVRIAAAKAPGTIRIDPNVNLLATINLTN